MRSLSQLRTALSLVCLLTAGLSGEVVQPQPAAGAEEIRVVVGGPLTLTVSVDALEQFAETGEARGDLALISRFAGEPVQETIRQRLTQPIPLDLVTVDNLASSPLGRDVISNVGKVVRVHPEVNGFYGLRAAILGAAAAAGPDGWTMLDVLRQFPSDSIDVSLGDLLALRQTLTVYLDYNQAVVEAIQQQATAEAAAQPVIEAASLPDLSQPGPYAVVKETITVRNPALRQTNAGLTVNYDFPVDVYYSEGRVEPAPVVIISHGFGDVKESFTFIAEHLASYGIVTIIPAHVGSDFSYRQEFLQGRLNTLLSPMEFLNRPQEISFLIDELERLANRSSGWAARLDLDRIGIMGDSLGGSTALALAGAEINYARLAADCNRDNVILNFTLYLECRARFLPPGGYQLRDERIKAVVAMHPMGGYLYGPEGMAQIEIPLLMISGSDDVVSPVVTEQIYPFIWAESDPKYLALLQVGTHFTSKPGRDQAEGIFQLLAGEHRDIGIRYAKTMVTAFWRAYLTDAQDARDRSPYLTADYARTLSADQPLKLDIIQSLAAGRLVEAYGRALPIPIDPPAIALPPARDETVLAEIRRAGVLKVGFRKDAPPFGYINPASEWDGYCGSLAIALGEHLTSALESPVAVELVELTSTSQNRFELVRDGSVHLECGPNTVQSGVEGVTFSQPVLTVGTRFLVTAGKADAIDPSSPLENIRLGVVQDTTAEALVQATYPEATLIPFTDPNGRQSGVRAVASGQIDAFVGDDVLTYAELLQTGQAVSNFALLPERSLACEFYGLILPGDDADWKGIVDAFLASNAADAVFEDWFGGTFPFSLTADARLCDVP
ncbi:MAG: alpha/beta hydrolase [Elainellaceae cyanobacterium]